MSDTVETVDLDESITSMQNSSVLVSESPPTATASILRTIRSYEGSTECLNEYAGFEPEPGVTLLEERIKASEITPQQFFDQYISKRRPVALTGHLNDSCWFGHRWTNKYLREKAGRTKVLVEKRHVQDAGGLGGFGPKSDMQYGQFLAEIESGHEGFYMTTQDLERDDADLDDYGMPQSVIAEPLKSLAGDFPVRPALLGNLVPYQLSLWQGSSQAGASSGLHHDYHDNLYVLVRGRKRFRLFPPSAAELLRTTGRLTKIHPNGLIVYEFKPSCRTVNIRADGVPLSFLARRKREEAEAQIVEAEDELLCLHDEGGNVRRGGAGAGEVQRLRKFIADCEDRIDEATQETMRYGDISDDDDKDEIISIPDSDDELAEPVAKQARLEMSGETAKTSHAASEGTATAVRSKLEANFCNLTLPSSCSSEELEKFIFDLCAKPGISSGEAVASNELTTVELKNNTDTATTNMVVDELQSEEPVVCSDGTVPQMAIANESAVSENNDKLVSNFAVDCKEGRSVDGSVGVATKIGCLVIELKPGEMLYIPASWFHEVTSCDIANNNVTLPDASKVADSIARANESNQKTVPGIDIDAAMEPVTIVNSARSADALDKQQTSRSDAPLEGDSFTNVSTSGGAQGDQRPAPSTALLIADKLETTKVEAETASDLAKSNLNDVAIDSDNSRQTTSIDNSAAVSAKDDRGHLAFNYWMFPPDSNEFTRPYIDQFWPRRWYELEAFRTARTGPSNRRRQQELIDDYEDSDDDNDGSVINLDSDDSGDVVDEDIDDDDDLIDENSSDCYTTEGPSSLSHSSPLRQRQLNFLTTVVQTSSDYLHRRPPQQNVSSGRAVMIDDTSSFCEITDNEDGESIASDDDVDELIRVRSNGDGKFVANDTAIAGSSECDLHMNGKDITSCGVVNSESSIETLEKNKTNTGKNEDEENTNGVSVNVSRTELKNQETVENGVDSNNCAVKNGACSSAPTVVNVDETIQHSNGSGNIGKLAAATNSKIGENGDELSTELITNGGASEIADALLSDFGVPQKCAQSDALDADDNDLDKILDEIDDEQPLDDVIDDKLLD